ncbi:MAG: response regulator [Paracoccaceae bacterium]
MRVLIVKENTDLAKVWVGHLERQGHVVELADSQSKAVRFLLKTTVDIIVLDLVMRGGSAFAIADFVSYRLPDAKIIFVSDSNFFSDGSIFQHIPNACAMMPTKMRPEDLGALVEHYGPH